jgi:hypothetical protein
VKASLRVDGWRIFLTAFDEPANALLQGPAGAAGSAQVAARADPVPRQDGHGLVMEGKLDPGGAFSVCLGDKTPW